MATTSENDNCNSICVAKAPGPTFTVTFSPKVSPLRKEVDYAGISPIWRIRGFHKQLQSSSWLHGKMEQRKNTVHTYMAKLLYSEANQSYSTTCSTCAWLSHSTISTRPYIQCRQHCQKYLSSYVTSEDGTCVGKHPPVSRLMIGVFQEKPPRPKYTEIWDVSIVLVYLQSLSPVNTLLLKELALKLVVLIFFSLRQKRSDCTFVEYWPHGFFK